MLAACFDKQQEAILCKARLKAILTSRRAGKTNTVLRAMILDAFEHPNAQYCYIALSRRTSEGIVWKELIDINDAHNLGLELQGYRLRANFPNGASLTLLGADRDDWMSGFKGMKYRQAAIDECGEFEKIDLHDFVYRVLLPCLTDHQGTLWMVGTPGQVPRGFWYQITRPDAENRAKGWTTFCWHSKHNPFIVNQYEADLTLRLSEFGDALYTLPWFRREWMGEWVFDTEANVYKYRPELSNIESFEQKLGDRFILAVDPGYKDATAFVVGVYNPARHENLIYIEAFKKPEMYFDQVADKIREYQDKYPGLRIIGDPDSAHLLAELRTRHAIPVENATKQKKQEAIAIMNNGFVSGKIKLLMPSCDALSAELSELKRQYKTSDAREEEHIKLGDWIEHPKQPNDCCDAALYIHRAAETYTFRSPEPPIVHGSEEYYEKLEQKMKNQARAKCNPQPLWWK